MVLTNSFLISSHLENITTCKNTMAIFNHSSYIIKVYSKCDNIYNIKRTWHISWKIDSKQNITYIGHDINVEFHAYINIKQEGDRKVYLLVSEHGNGS